MLRCLVGEYGTATVTIKNPLPWAITGGVLRYSLSGVGADSLVRSVHLVAVCVCAWFRVWFA